MFDQLSVVPGPESCSKYPKSHVIVHSLDLSQTGLAMLALGNADYILKYSYSNNA